MAEASDAYMIKKQGGQVEEMCFSRSPELSTLSTGTVDNPA